MRDQTNMVTVSPGGSPLGQIICCQVALFQLLTKQLEPYLFFLEGIASKLPWDWRTGASVYLDLKGDQRNNKW